MTQLMNNENAKGLLRTMVRSAYDLQKLRVEMGNRLCATFKHKLGYTAGEKEEHSLGKEEMKLLKELKVRFAKLTTGVARALPSKREWKGDGIISSYAEGCLIAEYLALEKSEVSQFNRLEGVLEEFPIYNEFLVKVRGCGPAMSAVIIAEIDIGKAAYPSSLWKFAGLDVSEGSGRSRRKEHLRSVEYIDKNGKAATKLGITFDPFLKTKLVGVFGPCLIKGKSEPYAQIYKDYKQRLEHHPKWAERSKGHRHNAAVRYMVKRFLADLYVAWRGLEGMRISPEYNEAKLGIKHRKAA
jgi:hypothetical protein